MLGIVGISALGSGPAQYCAPPKMISRPSNPDLYSRHRGGGPRELDLLSEPWAPLLLQSLAAQALGRLASTTNLQLSRPFLRTESSWGTKRFSPS